MITKNKQLKYVIYARKSSEGEDRQMASIEDQLSVIKRMASELALNVVHVITESKSAKAPGRPGFNELLTYFHEGKADGILCWKLNRLARNPIDGGQISWLLQNRMIQHIQCHGRDYWPHDNVLMMQVEFGMANQYVKDLSVDIQRGTIAKARRGWYPSPAIPVGYLHKAKYKLGEDEIIPDPERFPLIKAIWNLALCGNHNVADLKRRGDQMGLRDAQGKPYGKDTYHKILKHEFYCGFFYWKDENGDKTRYQGKHEAIVDPLDFAELQAKLRASGPSTRSKSYNYTFNGLLDCGYCDGRLTADRKMQVRCTRCRHKFSFKNTDRCPKCDLHIKKMKNASIIDITYYRCTKKRGTCPQKHIREDALIEMYAKVFSEFNLDKKIQKIIKEILAEHERHIHKTEKEKIALLNSRITQLKNRDEKLSIMRADGEITSENFQALSSKTRNHIDLLTSQIKRAQKAGTDWVSKAMKYMSKAATVKKILETGDKSTLKETLQLLGSNQKIMDKSLYFTWSKPVQAIQKLVKEVEAKTSPVEPDKTLIPQRDLPSSSYLYRLLCTAADDVRTRIIENGSDPKVINYEVKVRSLDEKYPKDVLNNAA